MTREEVQRARQRNIELFRETEEYIRSGRTALTAEEMSQAIFIGPEKVNELRTRCFEGPNPREDGTYIGVIDSGTVGAATILYSHHYKDILILNFASSTKPGGGVKRGARAQEETLCRQTTLLHSLESRDARPYYEMHRNLNSYLATDAVILSPKVQILRDDKYNWVRDYLGNCEKEDVLSGDVNNLGGYSGEFLDALYRYIPIVDDCIYDEDARTRCDAALRILIDLWPMMQRCFDALRDMKQQMQQNPQSSGTQQAGQPSNGTQAVEEALKSQRPEVAPNFTGKNGAAPGTGTYIPDKGQKEKLIAEVERVLSEETARIAAHVTQGIDGDGDGGISYNTVYEGCGYQYAAADMERVLEEVAKEQVNTSLEEGLSEELQREANAVSYGNAHRNIHVTVNRIANVSQDLIDSYAQVAPQLLQLSKRLQRSVSALLRDKRQGGKQTGLIVGKRLNQHALYREDGRVFCNSKLPTEPIGMSVGLLIDESGSMAGSDRITKARATAIVVQDFCEKLGIPIMITGHTASSAHVELYSYAAFDSVDRKDRYRLMDMSARYCNRDGAALRFAAEQLCKQASEVKMLFIICDGQPNDSGYSGTAAEADLRGIKLEYSRKGVQIFAAAIGDDREKIERIYGNGFLDITDLNRLPVMLTQLIARNLPV